MSKTYRFSLVLLSAAVLFALSDSRSAFGQRFRSGGNSNQGNSEKKKDKDEEDKKDKKNRGDQGNQGNQGGQGTQGQGGNSGNNQGNQGNQGNSNNNQGGGSNKQGKKDSNNQGNTNNNQGSNQNNKQGNTNNNQNANQNNNSNNPNASNSGKGGANKSGNSNVPSQFPPFIQGGRNQNDKDKDKDKKNKDGRDSDDQGQNLQGQGGRFLNPGRDGKPGNNQGVIIGPGGAGNAEQTNRKFGSWRGDRWEGSRKADHWTEVFGGKQKLFSSQWYKDHPQAFKYNNDKANVWVVASVPGIYSWLGWGAVPQQYAVGYGPSERFDASIYGEWYPLGVYSLMSGGDDMGTRVVQLAVDRHGHLSGNYYDMITNDDKSLSGEIDRQSQRVTFWLNRNPNVHFHASVYRLLQQPYGTITVHLPGAEQRWQFVRLED